ncbi:MAG: isoprenylcysteine carboxylmethyltransferase family protein [Acidobacteriota bacterium]
MELSVQLYLALLACVAVGRLLELRHSRRNQQLLFEAGATKSPEPAYPWMVALHTAILGGSALEVVALHRPWNPWLGSLSLVAFLAANAARWWVMRTLGTRWNVQVLSASRLGVITAAGPYRWVRHPNYSAVFIEMLALPLIHSAFFVAFFGALLHAVILYQRVTLEEAVLRRDPSWKAAFEHRPRFLPGLL